MEDDEEIIVIDKESLREAIQRMGRRYLNEYGWEHIQAASMNLYLQEELPEALAKPADSEIEQTRDSAEHSDRSEDDV